MRTIFKCPVYLGAITLLLLLNSCSQPKEETPKDDHFVISDSLIRKLVIDTVKGGNDKNQTSYSAKITANEDQMAQIYPMVSGIVKTVPVRLGDQVKAGQVLATMISADMAGFDKEAISAKAEYENAGRTWQQAEELFASGLASQRELEQAKNELQIRKAELQRSTAVLRINGGNKQDSYKLKSPVSGYVIEKKVTANMQLRPDNNQSLFTIADLSNVWGIVNIYESDISSVRQDDEVRISVLAYPDRQFSGRINKIYNVLDNDSKVMNARVVIDNPGNLLKPGMMASVQIDSRSENKLPVLNADCLIFDDNKNYVIVLDPVKKLRIQEVTVSRKTGGMVYISRGLKAGDRVVAARQVFLYESLSH